MKMQLQVQLHPHFQNFLKNILKKLTIRTNRECYYLVCELFKTLADIFETHMVFENMYVVLEDLIEKRQ